LKGGDYIFSLYKKMDLVLGMRFHANVCSIGQNIPNIGLISYHKHGYLFDEIGLSDRALYIKNNNFFKDLLIKTKTDLRNLEEIKMRYSFVNQELNSEIKMFHQLIEDFLLNNL
ncbi:MAG: polysaccharide pyruvyl transferase family protein, partial [Bacilli bacterium]